MTHRIPRTTKLSTAHRAALALLVAAIALLTSASLARATPNQLSVFQDDAHLLSHDPATRASALDKIQNLGADAVKISLLWRSVSPSPDSHSRPGGITTSPDYYNWGVVPDVLNEIQARGMIPWVMATEVGPDWASSSAATKSQPGGYKPDPDLFGDFAVAAYTRFPAVPFFQVGNEPNFQLWLWPQVVKNKVSASAVHYRKMYINAQDKILAQGLNGRQLLFGGLAPRASKPTNGQRATQPIRFMRDFFCLDDKLKPLKGSAAKARECTGKYKQIKATGFSYHPYTTKEGPQFKVKPADDAPINYMNRVYKVLDAAYKYKRVSKKKLPVWNDEFAYESNPPDPIRAPLAKIPQFLNESEYISWADSRMRSYAQYQLYDEPVGNAAPGAKVKNAPGFQSGLYFFDGSTKGGVAAAYSLPIVAIKTSKQNKVIVWFGVRNKRALNSPLATVQFRNRGSSKWRPVATVLKFSGGRYSRLTVTANGAARGQFRVVSGDLTSRTAKVAAAPKAMK